MSSHEEPGFELPAPQAEAALPSGTSAEAGPVKAEQQSRAAELPGSSVPSVPAPPPTTNDPSAIQPTTVDPVPTASATSTVAVPNIADDADLIEKEWVDKAKAIVDRTRDDPHQQNKQLNAFKADYMMKRYSKEIRLSDEQT